MKLKLSFLYVFYFVLSASFVFMPKTLFAQSQESKGVIILLAHPNMKESKANKALIDSLKGIKDVRVVDMYTAPFTVEYYTNEIKDAKTVVFQFPFYWASAPSQLKKWQDEIFMSMGEIVKGKNLLVVTTTGSDYNSYRTGGRNKFTMDELLRPYEFTANYTGMIWQTPFIVYAPGTPAGQANMKNTIKEYKERIINLSK